MKKILLGLGLPLLAIPVMASVSCSSDDTNQRQKAKDNISKRTFEEALELLKENTTEKSPYTYTNKALNMLFNNVKLSGATRTFSIAIDIPNEISVIALGDFNFGLDLDKKPITKLTAKWVMTTLNIKPKTKGITQELITQVVIFIEENNIPDNPMTPEGLVEQLSKLFDGLTRDVFDDSFPIVAIELPTDDNKLLSLNVWKEEAYRFGVDKNGNNIIIISAIVSPTK